MLSSSSCAVCGRYFHISSAVKESTGAISTAEAERLLAFCNNSGPAFVIGAVGVGVFGSSKTGLVLYAIHCCAAVCTGLLFRTGSPAPPGQEACRAVVLPLSQALPEAVRQAVISILSVCGFVVCFTVFTGLLDANGFFSVFAGRLADLTGRELHWCRALLCGLLELGSGTGAMRGLTLSPINMALAAFLLSWGGLSVQFQTMAVLSESKMKGALHLAGRLVSACIAAVLGYAAGFLWF